MKQTFTQAVTEQLLSESQYGYLPDGSRTKDFDSYQDQWELYELRSWERYEEQKKEEAIQAAMKAQQPPTIGGMFNDAVDWILEPKVPRQRKFYLPDGSTTTNYFKFRKAAQDHRAYMGVLRQKNQDRVN